MSTDEFEELRQREAERAAAEQRRKEWLAGLAVGAQVAIPMRRRGYGKHGATYAIRTVERLTSTQIVIAPKPEAAIDRFAGARFRREDGRQVGLSRSDEAATLVEPTPACAAANLRARNEDRAESLLDKLGRRLRDDAPAFDDETLARLVDVLTAADKASDRSAAAPAPR